MKNIFAVFLYLVLLATSGQVLAAGDCTSAATGNWGAFATWADGTGGGAACDAAAAIPAAGDNAIIAHAVTVAAAASITDLTVNAGKTLTLSAALTVTGTATISGGITYTTGTWPPAITSVGEKLTTTLSAAYTLPNTVTSIGGGLEVSGNALTLAAANVVTGNVATSGGGTIAGTLKLNDANHTITIEAAKTIPILDASAFTGTTKTITTSGAFLLTIPTLTPPSTASAVVKIVVGAGGSLTVTNAPAGATCTSDAAATGTQATTAFPVTSLAGGKTLVCTKNAASTVSAPIFSTKEKPAVFSEEAKH